MDRKMRALFPLLLLILLPLPATSAPPPAHLAAADVADPSGGASPAEDAVQTAPDVIAGAVTWKGTIRVAHPVRVGNGAVLTIGPGTVVLFEKGAGLVVEGTLNAEGTADRPVRFAAAGAEPAPGEWAGIEFGAGAGGSSLRRCLIVNAAAVTITGSSPRISDCVIEKGTTGLVVSQKAGPSITGNVIRAMSGGGIDCRMESSPTLEKNVIISCGPFGISSSQSASPVVRSNIVTDCEKGLALAGAVPPVEGNLFGKNGVGLLAVSVGREQVIRSNRFFRNGTGIACVQFSEPVIENNELARNGDALVCHRSSGPLVRRNEFRRNAQGIVCTNISAPEIVANDIHGNGKGIFLTLSSYATVRGNNIHANGVQMELGNMSSDWEKRVARKPGRGSVAQAETRIGRGVAPALEGAVPQGDGAVIMGAVDASGNWWGERDTEEMERKGPRADIGTLIDYHDVPVRTYEGYPGEYVQDRIVYDGWKKTRIPDAGPAGKGAERGG